jgi:hypothetical protein
MLISLNRFGVLLILTIVISSCGTSNKLSSSNNKNSNAFDKKIEDLKIDKSLETVNQKIYLNDYEGALASLDSLNAIYPKNDVINTKTEQVINTIYSKRKKEILKNKPTRNVIEFNFGLATTPNQFITDNKFKITDQKYILDDLFSSFQLGLYKKFKIRDRNNRLSSAKYKYSQAGIRIGYVNPNSGVYNLKGDTIRNFNSKIGTISASLIARRFLMINFGIVSFLDSTGRNFSNNNYGFGEIGIRIPFGPIHFTSDVSTISNFDRIYQVFFKFGMSVNIGVNKRFNSSDAMFLRNKIKSRNF